MPRSLLTAVILVGLAGPACASTVVFDSISANVYTGGSGFNMTTEVGDQIALTGYSSATIETFEFATASYSGFSYSVHFRENNGPNGEPGTLLWSSPTQTVAGQGSWGTIVASIAVPNVVVPDTFTWTIRPTAAGAGGHVRNGDLTGIGDAVSTSGG